MVIPAIIDKSGQVVYATKSMGRVVKYINGQLDTTYTRTSNVYINSDLKNVYTLINHGSISDVPVIEDLGNVAKIQVSGYTGWVNKDKSAKDYDLEIVPITSVTNASYYDVTDGILYHAISRNLTNDVELVDFIPLGPAPSYLKEGFKYLSYDGKYFYDGSNIAKGLGVLISDLQANNKSNSINKDNPYYNYYDHLPFRSNTKYTAEEIDKFI